MTSESQEHAAETLSGRLRVVTLARIVAVLATLVILAPASGVGGSDGARDPLSVTSGIYLAANFVVLLLLRFAPRSARWLLELSLVLDAVWVTAVLWATGGASSPFIFLLYLQLVAVTVLFTWRVGVELAVAHTLGLAWLALVADGPTDGGLSGGALPDVRFGTDLAAFDILALWVIAGAIAYFASVNDRDLRRSNQELAVLRELNTQLEASLDMDDVCEAIAGGVVEELGYERAIVWLSQPGAELRPAGTAGFEPEAIEPLDDLRLPASMGPVGAAVRAREPQLVPREAPRPGALAQAFGHGSPLVVVPLMSEGRLLGLLTVEVAAPPAGPPRIRGRELRILATLATEASLALDNARLHAELRDLSVTDALTGVYNHRYFQQRLQEELDRAVRNEQDGVPEPVSLIMLDLDYFKAVNDRFGHPSGDELLRAIARLSDRVLRSTDVVCRYGGEEFTVVLPNTSLAQAEQVAERFREAVARSNFTGADGRYLGRVTASFGVAAFTEGTPSRSDLIQRADDALYAAKEAGRNRVVVCRGSDSAAGADAADTGGGSGGLPDAVVERPDPRGVEL